MRNYLCIACVLAALPSLSQANSYVLTINESPIDRPSGVATVWPAAVSNTGIVVHEGAYWSDASGVNTFEHSGVYGRDISADGTKILTYIVGVGGHIYENGEHTLISSADGSRSISGIAMSNDVTVIVGQRLNSPYVGFDHYSLWTAEDGFQNLHEGRYRDVSPNGQYAIAKYSENLSKLISLETNDVTDLTSPLRVGGDLEVRAVANDGTVAGRSNFPIHKTIITRAAIWKNGEIRHLGNLNPDIGSGTAYAISANGNIVGGSTSTNDSDPSTRGATEAFIWDEVNGMRSVEDLLKANGHNLGGAILTKTTAVSNDGNVIAGHGENQYGHPIAWKVSVTPECTPSAW